jgi:ubiquinone/menaquinone biosynthesis C-methylase UbiE
MDEDASYLPPAEGFALLADTYDARLSGDPALKQESEALLALIPSLEGKVVGDIGCGTGRYTLPLARTRAVEVIGIDLCAAMLARARRKAADAELPVKLARGDLLGALPLPDGYLDVALCARVLSFVSDLPRAFTELARTLAPGGVLLVSELHPQGLCAARAESRAALRKDHAPYLRFMDFEGAERRIAREPHLISHYLDAATAAGLTLERLVEPRDERVGVPLALALRFRAP